MDRDVEKFGEDLSDDELLEKVGAGVDEEQVMGFLKEFVRRKRPDRMAVYRRVLSDPKQSTAARRVLVRELGKQPLPENQALLLQLLETAEAPLFSPVVQALGRMGAEGALERLEKIKAPVEPAAQRTLEFARSLLAYRLRLNRHLLPVPAASQIVKVKDGVPMEIKKTSARVAREIIQDTREDLPGITLAETGAVGLKCFTNNLLLALNQEFQSSRCAAQPSRAQRRAAGSIEKRILARPLYPGHLSVCSPAQGRQKAGPHRDPPGR